MAERTLDLLYRSLSTDPIAPDFGFERFIVGDPLRQARAAVVKTLDEMQGGPQPSRLMLIVGENGNGKSLLANWLKSHLSNANTSPDVQGATLARFDALYSHVSALGTGSSQLPLEIAANLRRSQVEPPDFTYSLIAIEIVRRFEAEYRPPLYWWLSFHIGKATADLASMGILGKIEEGLKDKSARPIQQALEAGTGAVQRALTGRHYRKAFERFISGLDFDSFVKSYFGQRGKLGMDQLRRGFLDDFSSVPRPLDWVVDQLAKMAKAVDCKLVAILVDDCNRRADIDQLLPLINRLAEFRSPKVALIVSMVKGVADDLKETPALDLSVRQRLFYNPVIELPPPSDAEIGSLFGRLRDLRHEAYPDQFVREGLGSDAVRDWRAEVDAGSIEGNYRSAVGFLTAFLNRQAKLG